MRVELDSKGVKRTEAGREVSCAELRRGIYFESGKYRVERNQWDSASPLAKQFLDDTKSNDASAVTRSLLITGYADPMSEVKTGNPVLARQRACHVYARMKPLLDEPLASNVFIDSRIGTGDPVCSNKEKAGDLRACYEKDRRVTLQRIDTKEKLDRVGAVAVKDACVELDAMVREIASTSPSASDK